MSKLDFNIVVKQEEERLQRLHPTPSDVPGCLSLFDDYLSCSGGFTNIAPPPYTDTLVQSSVPKSNQYIGMANDRNALPNSRNLNFV